MKKLNPAFMAELFKLMFTDETIIRLAAQYLKYELIPKEWAGYKFIFKDAVQQFENLNKIPSLGSICQKYADNNFVQDTYKEIKKANLVDREIIIDQMQSFIKETEFELLSKQVHDLYSEGKREEAIRVNAEESARILGISLRIQTNAFQSLFGGFQERMRKRREDAEKIEKDITKVPFGIDKLDDITYGGSEIGDTVMWIARSGAGKSMALRWHAFSTAVRGIPTLHIQLEGGIDACTRNFDQMWTNWDYKDIRTGNIRAEDKKKIEETIFNMKQRDFDLEIYGFQKFGEASVYDIRNLCYDYRNVKGYFPKLVTIDSLDLLKTGMSKKIDTDPDYKKSKLQTCAQRLKDLADEIKGVVCVATQTGDVPFEVWNNPDKVIDRSYTEGDRTLVKPFSFVFTVNITMSEKVDEKCRIYIDKFRDYKDSSQVVSIATNYDKKRFYHRGRSMELYNQVELRKETKKRERKKEKTEQI